jgi:competence protein ComEC
MAAGAIAAVLLRRHPVAFVLGLGFFAIAAGFAVATLKTVLIDHPVLRYPGIMAQTLLRWSGAVLAVLTIIWAARAPVPNILVAADGRSFAVRGADGRLAFHHAGGDAFAIHEWLAADSDGRDPRDPGLGNGISCDPSGCIGKLGDGRLVAYALGPDSFEEDCRHATIIVATREAPPDCAATVIGRSLWRARGALALRRDGAGFVIDSARPPNFDRPWAPTVAQQSARSAAANADAAAVPPAASRSQPRDATPRPEDLDPND